MLKTTWYVEYFFYLCYSKRFVVFLQLLMLLLMLFELFPCFPFCFFFLIFRSVVHSVIGFLAPSDSVKTSLKTNFISFIRLFNFNFVFLRKLCQLSFWLAIFFRLLLWEIFIC